MDEFMLWNETFLKKKLLATDFISGHSKTQIDFTTMKMEMLKC